MNVTVFHYFLFSFERTRLPAYCLKPTPCDCSAVKSVFQPVASHTIRLPQHFLPIAPDAGTMCVRKELQHAVVDNSTFCAKVWASARFLRLALESRSLQRCTRARFISCEYACFLLRYLCVGGCRGSLSLCRLAIQTGSFLFPSLPQPLTVTLNFQADAGVLLRASVSQRASGCVPLSPTSEIPPFCTWI